MPMGKLTTQTGESLVIFFLKHITPEMCKQIHRRIRSSEFEKETHVLTDREDTSSNMGIPCQSFIVTYESVNV